jgi:protein-S-isoprenylcysteine O-methyltransferase Ste14
MRWLGWGLITFFAFWNGWSLALFHRRHTGLLPGQPTRTLMTSGPFAVSRNPLYLGLMALYVGTALILPSTWALLAAPVAFLALDRGAIRPEEAMLEAEFGAAYRDYADSVRRWL